MRISLRTSTASIGASFAALVFVLASISLVFNWMTGRADAADPAGHAGRLITIHDRGVQKVLLSDADTIQGALDDAGISVDDRDAVEPALDEKLVASEYNVNIYRARPVTIIDGSWRQKVITPYQTAAQIAEDAGIRLYPEDRTALSRSNDIIADGAGLQLIIDRATAFGLNLYGKSSKVRTQGETVGAMLQEKGIVLGVNDRTAPALTTPVTTGMQVKIWREGKQTITVNEKVAFSIEQIQDADREIGYRSVKTPGKNGQRRVTYEIVVKNGREVARKEIASIVTAPARKQVEIVGAKIVLSVSFSADRAAIMTAAGVAPRDQEFAAYIINNENALWCAIRWQGTSGCAATYYEKFPGAEGSDQVGYGLCQATPGNKMASAGSDWRTNEVTQMRWCHNYALGRYGSWEAAYRFKVANGWW